MESENKYFYKKLLTLVLPIAFQQFMMSAVSASDAIMLGAIDQNSLSAVSLAGQIQFVFSLFLTAIAIGTSMFAAQYWGKHDIEAVEKIFAMVIRFTIYISVVFFIAVTFFPASLMRIFTNDTDLILRGTGYLKAVGLSYLLTGISQIYLCMMKNTGHAIRSSIISAVTVIINIFLNAVLIFGLLGMPKMSITGAALATVIANIVQFIWVILEFKRKTWIKVRMKYIMTIDKLLRKDFWKYTLPVLGNEIVWGCGFTMYSVIMGHLGTDAVAANSIANIVKNLAACFCIGIGSGGGIIVGNELGSGNLARAKSFGTRLCRMSIISGAVSGVILLLIAPIVLRYSNLSGQANNYLKWMLIMCSYYMIGKSVNSTTIGGIFCAGGDSKFGFVCDTITLWCITIPLGLIAAFVLNMPVTVVYFIVNLDEIIKLPAVYKRYKQYKWVNDLTRNEM